MKRKVNEDCPYSVYVLINDHVHDDFKSVDCVFVK